MLGRTQTVLTSNLLQFTMSTMNYDTRPQLGDCLTGTQLQTVCMFSLYYVGKLLFFSAYINDFPLIPVSILYKHVDCYFVCSRTHAHFQPGCSLLLQLIPFMLDLW